MIFVVWSDKDKSVYESLIPEYFPPSEDDVPAEEESQGEPVPESQLEEEWEEVNNVEGDKAEAAEKLEPKVEEKK